MDTGGLAHMTYNNNNSFPSTGGLGAPGSGFASRGKGAHIKRLSVAPPPTIGSINEDEVDVNPAPRTSRSHLLSGLRTAPKTPGVPASAPYHQTQHRFGTDGYSGVPMNTGHGNNNNNRYGNAMPQTATASQFPRYQQNQYGMAYSQQQQYQNQQLYCLPEQVLAPNINLGDGVDQMDPQLYNELMATNLYLTQRQQQLQQQLMNVTAAAQQFQGLNLGNHHTPATPITPQASYYNQQLQNGVQPIVQAVPNQPGLYSVYNPLTGQHYFVNPAADQVNTNSPPSATPSFGNSSPESDNQSFDRRDTTSPPSAAVTKQPWTTASPKSNSPPQEVTPLPPPSANAFRPGHRKSVNSFGGANIKTDFNGPRTAGLKSAFPQTPATGTFGPGMARAGEHPIRQPRGPPPLEELTAAPTSKHEGSKNFATRQRRRAVHNLVKAGNERRSGRGSGLDTPNSEGEFNFIVSPSEGSSDGLVSHPSSRHSSIGSLRGSASGAIGSEVKELKERSRDRRSPSRHLTGSSFSSDEGKGPATKPDAKAEEAQPTTDSWRKAPMLVLNSAEKRKSQMF